MTSDSSLIQSNLRTILDAALNASHSTCHGIDVKNLKVQIKTMKCEINKLEGNLGISVSEEVPDKKIDRLLSFEGQMPMDARIISAFEILRDKLVNQDPPLFKTKAVTSSYIYISKSAIVARQLKHIKPTELLLSILDRLEQYIILINRQTVDYRFLDVAFLTQTSYLSCFFESTKNSQGHVINGLFFNMLSPMSDIRPVANIFKDLERFITETFSLYDLNQKVLDVDLTPLITAIKTPPQKVNGGAPMDGIDRMEFSKSRMYQYFSLERKQKTCLMLEDPSKIVRIVERLEEIVDNFGNIKSIFD